LIILKISGLINDSPRPVRFKNDGRIWS